MTLIESLLLTAVALGYMCIGYILLIRKIKSNPMEWMLLGPRGRALATIIMLILWLPFLALDTLWQLITGKE